MLALENKGNGLLSKMIKENLTKEEIYKVLIDFIIAAGDTVQNLEFVLNILTSIVYEFKKSV